MSGIPSWARKGVKVVCIQGGDPNCEGFAVVGQYPVTSGVYTIGRAFINRYGRSLIDLEEFPSGDADLGWGVRRFRPLVSKTKEHDLATHFEQYLKTDHRATRRVGEDA